MKRSSKSFMLKVVFAFAVALMGVMSVAQHAHAAGYGDPHNCQALAQGANSGWPNYAATPFDAWQVPGSQPFSFTNNYGQSDYLVACQPAFWEGNFENAFWDGYGNPFQCVELIDRYDWLRWHDTDGNGNRWVWQDAYQDWDNHPAHFQQRPNGTNSAPAVGDILVWTTGDHIAVITGMNFASRYATILEQNSTYNGGYYMSKRLLYFGTVRADGSTWYTFSGASTWYDQNGNGYYVGSGTPPMGWLH